jgi:hypothetical protein
VGVGGVWAMHGTHCHVVCPLITLSIKMGNHLEVQLVNPDIISIPSLGNR